MTNRSRSVRRRGRWLVAAPAVAAIAVTMTACSNGEVPAPKDAVYTTPAPFVGSTPTEQPAESDRFTGYKASLINLDGGAIGTAVFGENEEGLDVTLNIVGATFPAGVYKVGLTDVGDCQATGDFASAGDLRTFGDAAEPITLSVPVSSGGSGTLDTTIPDADIHRLTEGDGSAVVLLDSDDARVACGDIRAA